jgi:4-oxalomesaconate tautomerase
MGCVAVALWLEVTERLMSSAAEVTGIRCMLMRGGTSKGAYFLAEDLPADPGERDDLLLRIMGSPDPRQIDGIGGAHPLTSKVAVISRSARDDADVDYLFLQVGVDEATVSDRQNCGNLLAGVGPFAVERGLAEKAPVRIHMVNSGSVATARFPGTSGVVSYAGDTKIAGVPGTAAAVVLDFAGTEGSATGALLPTGNVRDVIDGVPVTCIDNGMPVVVVKASDLGRTGYETVADLEADAELNKRVQALRLAAGKLMGLGDVSGTSVPKISLVAAPADGGTICTRTFIPVRVHDSIGVLGAVSVATAVLLEGAVGHDPGVTGPRLDIEHPTGHLHIEAEVDQTVRPPKVLRSGVVRTARKLFDGVVYPRAAGNGTQG